ncbi:hypothetical protein DRN98_01270, partial [Methanosarcinales archaeon]
SQLPDKFDAGIVIVQHMPGFISKSIVNTLGEVTKHTVKLAEDGEVLTPGVIYLAPGGDKHLIVENRSIMLVDGEKVNFCRPSVDVMMNSVAEEFEERTIGVILTGMGHDGAMGIVKIKEHGGYTIAQDKVTSAVFGMPGAAINTGKIDRVLPSYMIAPEFTSIIEQRTFT